MNITVYLGAAGSGDEKIRDEARRFGAWIAEGGHTLIYGGSKVGLMGVLAQSVMESGGRVIGVEPRMFVESEQQYDEITELIVTEDMTERKNLMLEMGDVFVAFPGGTGTLEEMSEAVSQTSLGFMDALCIFYDIDGYYGHLRAHFQKMIAAGFSSEKRQSKVFFAGTLEDITKIIEGA